MSCKKRFHKQGSTPERHREKVPTTRSENANGCLLGESYVDVDVDIFGGGHIRSGIVDADVDADVDCTRKQP